MIRFLISIAQDECFFCFFFVFFSFQHKSSAPDNYFSNHYRTDQVQVQSVTKKTGILESVSLLRTLFYLDQGLVGTGVVWFKELL